MKDISSKLVLCNALFALFLLARSRSAFQKTNKTQKIPLSGIACLSLSAATHRQQQQQLQRRAAKEEEEQKPMLKN